MASDYQLSVDVIGASELSAALKSSNIVIIKALTDAVNKTAITLRKKAADNAPHDKGHLRDSIHVELAVATRDNVTAKVGTSPNIPYARAQEYGTQGMVIHGRSKLGKRFDYKGNIPPKFYMKRAKEDIRPIMTTNMQAALKKIVNYFVNKII